MAVNTFGVVATKPGAGQIAVDGKIAYLELSSVSSPTAKEVETWIGDAAAELSLALANHGVVAADLSLGDPDAEDLYRACRSMLCQKIAGMVHAASQAGSTTLAERYEAAWSGFLRGLKTNPGQYLAEHRRTMRTGRASGDSTAPRRSYWRRDLGNL